MASIHSQKGKSGKKTYHVVVSHRRSHKWLRAGTLKDAKLLWPYSKAFTFLLNTGLRSGELCNLTWDDVDLDNGLIHVRAKSGWTPKSYERSFFLNETCVKLLRSLPEDDGYIFRSFLDHQLTTDDLRRVLMKVAVASGLEDLTRVHDLRHTFNSLMQMSGVDAGTMARILGYPIPANCFLQ